MIRLYVRICITVLLVCATRATFAGPVLIESEVKRVYGAPELASEERLAEVGFWTRRYHISRTTSDGHLETNKVNQMYAWYRTKNLEDLEKFVFVQFIKGCVYDTFVEENQVKVRWSTKRTFFGQLHTFVHPQWVIDSIDVDPVFWSLENRVPSRHFALRWGVPDGVYPSRLEDFPYYGKERPSSPRLFTFDSSQPAGLRWNPWGKIAIATNVSLHHRTCLYKKDDVPNSAQPDDIDFATPIVCMEWDSSHVYDHEKKTMTSPKEISAKCMAPPTEDTHPESPS